MSDVDDGFDGWGVGELRAVCLTLEPSASLLPEEQSLPPSSPKAESRPLRALPRAGRQELSLTSVPSCLLFTPSGEKAADPPGSIGKEVLHEDCALPEMRLFTDLTQLSL